MEKYLKLLNNLIAQKGKPWVAHVLGLNTTQAIDGWLQRDLIPSKYLDRLDELKKEKK